ncbi:nicotinamide N-methyltransferase-like [Eleutherodactylus coqui]|uniref:nicotinamide N-methyltransferase-like n=1 Tax=Eleutherodactylus coqui TaxID=57060 RepID=UPI003462E45A
MSYTILKNYFSKELNIKELVESHFAHEDVSIIKESMCEPMKRLHEVFSSGLVKGNRMLESSIGGIIYPLFPASNCFKEIHIIDVTDASVNQCKQWLENGDEATDWSFAAKFVSQLEGNEDGWKEKEEQVRSAVKGVFKYGLLDSNSKNSVAIPEVDCILTVFLFNVICQTKEDFKHNLKIFTSWLKVGGYLVFIFALNMTCYRVGDQLFSTLTVDNKFIRKVMTDTGYVIEKEEVIPTAKENDLTDYKDMVCIVAKRVRKT